MSLESYAVSSPSRWVRRFAPLIPTGQVLDLASGAGRHVPLLAGLGHEVLAADRDSTALAALPAPNVTTLVWDFETPRTAWPFARDRFAGIVMTNYLHRPLFPHMLASLAPQGILIAETFAAGNAAFGKPASPDFLLNPGELLTLLRDHAPNGYAMRVIAFEDGHTLQPKPAMVQRVCAIKVPLAQARGPLEPGLVGLDGWQGMNKM